MRISYKNSKIKIKNSKETIEKIIDQLRDEAQINHQV